MKSKKTVLGISVVEGPGHAKNRAKNSIPSPVPKGNDAPRSKPKKLPGAYPID